MGHHIADMKILIMTDCGKDRHRILGNYGRKIIVIETCKIQFRATTAEYQNRIPPAAILNDCIKSRNDGLRTIHALHKCRKESHVKRESIWVLGDMPYKIPVTGGILGGNDSYIIRQKRKLKTLLQVHQPLFLKPFNCPLSFKFLDSQREFRIYIIYYQRQTIKLAVIHLNLHKHNHPLLNRRPGHCFEIWCNDTVF